MFDNATTFNCEDSQIYADAVALRVRTATEKEGENEARKRWEVQAGR